MGLLDVKTLINNRSLTFWDVNGLANHVPDFSGLYNFNVTQPDNNNVNSGNKEKSQQRINVSNSKFRYTASSQQIMHDAGSYFHKKGTYTPRRGDIAIWTNARDTTHGHVGIVTKIEGDTVWITEGNSGDAVKTNKYSLAKLMSNSGNRPFNGFIDAHGWLGSATALKAAAVAEKEEAKGIREISKNDSDDIRKYKRYAIDNAPWCANFTSYCFTDGQNLTALA